MNLELLKDEALAEVSGGGYAGSITKGACSPITSFGEAADRFCSSEVNGQQRAEMISNGISRVAASTLIGVGITLGAKKIVSFVKSRKFLKK